MKKVSIYNSFIKDNKMKREALATKLNQNGFHTTKNGELLIVIGGDGTFLSAVRKRFEQNPVFVGFNAGNLGFLSEFSMQDTDEFITMLKKKDYWIQELPLYEVHFKEDNKMKIEYFVNDFVVERKSTRILHMGVKVNEQSLGTISGDAIIVSSALGSTGYNMSAGGAISLTSENFMQLTPVSSVHSSAYNSPSNSMILNHDSEITIFPNIKKQREFRIVCDGREVRTKNVRYLEVKKSKRTVRVLRSNNYNPMSHLNQKMFTFD